jgi:hypothetical protein
LPFYGRSILSENEKDNNDEDNSNNNNDNENNQKINKGLLTLEVLYFLFYYSTMDIKNFGE